MNKYVKNISAALFSVLLLATVTACQKEAGPAERAGEAVDNAVEKAGEKIEKAGEDIQDAAENNK